VPVEVFSKEQFEAALPHNKEGQPLCQYKGLVLGEHSYELPVRNGFAISIRSSIRQGGLSAGTGEDSIRIWVVKSDTGLPYAPKSQKYITRVKGWEDRLTANLRLLWKVAWKLKPCPTCGAYMKAFRVKKAGKNHGRLFQTCRDCDYMEWINAE
jgi:hypothetical protein